MSFIPKPTDAELKILQVLWAHGPSSVRFVNDILSERKEVGYTTTLKLMQIMAEKGIVKRDTRSRTHIYIPAVEKEVTQGTLLNSFIETTFQGSAMNLVMQALGNHKTTEKELAEIKALIDQIEKSQEK